MAPRGASISECRPAGVSSPASARAPGGGCVTAACATEKFHSGRCPCPRRSPSAGGCSRAHGSRSGRCPCPRRSPSAGGCSAAHKISSSGGCSNRADLSVQWKLLRQAELPRAFPGEVMPQCRPQWPQLLHTVPLQGASLQCATLQVCVLQAARARAGGAAAGRAGDRPAQRRLEPDAAGRLDGAARGARGDNGKVPPAAASYLLGKGAQRGEGVGCRSRSRAPRGGPLHRAGALAGPHARLGEAHARQG